MKPALRFSVVLFAPLYVALLLPAAFLLPGSMLLTVIGFFDATISFSESARYGAWAFVPVLAAVSLFVIGFWCHSLWLGRRSGLIVWMGIWLVFSAALLVALWFGITIMTSVGASDHATGAFLKWTAGVAALFTLALQPGVGLWLSISSRILRRGGPKSSM
jgi:hypothetical protein